MTLAAGTSLPDVDHSAESRPIVFIVDNDHSARAYWESLVRAQNWLALTFGSANEFLAVPRAAVPCCLLLDFSLPDINGLDLQQRVCGRREMPVIFATHNTDLQVTVRALKAGALEYLTKPVEDAQLLAAIRSALARSDAIQHQEAAIRPVKERFASLTSRELQIMHFVASGWLNKQVGSALGISEATVKVHRYNVMRKMKANSLAELVRIASSLRLNLRPRGDDEFRWVVPERDGERDLLERWSAPLGRDDLWQANHECDPSLSDSKQASNVCALERFQLRRV